MPAPTPSASERAPQSPEYFDNPKTGELMAVRFDVTQGLEHEIGPDWQRILLEAIDQEGSVVTRTVDHWTCREADPTTRVSLLTLMGDRTQQLVPGLWDLYQGNFRDLMQSVLPLDEETLSVYEDPEPAIECLSQALADDDDDVENRLEAHVDMRFTAVLVVKAPRSSSEGRLVIANNPDAQTVEEIAADATYISHRDGTIVCFVRGGKYPHYTEEIKQHGSRRVVVSLNYPKPTETPEQTRELHAHILGGNNA